MAIQSTGVIKFSQIQGEFGGTHPIKASEYYRNGAYVTSNNTEIGTSGRLDLSDYYGTQRGLTLVYEIIGGGGAGGGGDSDGGGNGVYGASGGDSSLSGSGGGLSVSVTSTGGSGGLNGGISRLTWHGGEASYYGSGGSSGGNNAAGGAAPASSHGAGGGGGGGDAPSVFDRSGNAGIGGSASDRVTGEAMLVAGTQVTVVIGAGGPRNTYGYDGGAGASGYARLQVGNTVSEYPNAGTYTFTIPTT